MTVRTFDWRDLPALYRLRHQSVFLDSALVLTRGPLPVQGAVFSYLAPSLGVFTCVLDGRTAANASENGRGPVIGQFIHLPGASFSHMTFLTPNHALEGSLVSALLEYMMSMSGERGALRMLAEADEHTQAFEALRRCGFAIYSRQRIWQLTALSGRPPGGKKGSVYRRGWRSFRSQDTLAVRSLYNNLVPGLVQQLEPIATSQTRGLVYYQQDELLAFIDIKAGRRGIWVQPFIHPDAGLHGSLDVSQEFIDVLRRIPGRGSRPVYICVRSYQSWLEQAIEDLGAEAGPRQAVMARQLVIPQKATRSFALPVLEGGQTEISAPIVRMENK